MDFQNFSKINQSAHPLTFPGIIWGPTKMLAWSVQPFPCLFYTDTHPDKQSMYKLGFMRFAPIFYYNCNIFSFYTLSNKNKTKKREFKKRNLVDFQNFQKSNFARGKFLKIRLAINLPWGNAKSHEKLGPIGLAVLTFIGYKHPDRITSSTSSSVFR